MYVHWFWTRLPPLLMCPIYFLAYGCVVAQSPLVPLIYIVIAFDTLHSVLRKNKRLTLLIQVVPPWVACGYVDAYCLLRCRVKVVMVSGPLCLFVPQLLSQFNFRQTICCSPFCPQMVPIQSSSQFLPQWMLVQRPHLASVQWLWGCQLVLPSPWRSFVSWCFGNKY